MKIWKNIPTLLVLSVLVLGSFLTAQDIGRQYRGPDDPAGDEAYFRSAYMQGNRFLWYLNNNTSICDTGSGVSIWNRWPNNYQGVTLVHGINAVMVARVIVENDSIPVTDLEAARGRTDLDTLYFAQQGFRNRTDMDPTETFEWGMKPVYGYFNDLSDSFAMSNDSTSWPVNGWPAPDGRLKWPGEWNGRFGRGVIYADQAAFYVLNDAQDQEYTPANPENNGVFYFPRPGLKIGDKKPDVTIQKGLPWGGLGLRMEIRSFQWNNPQARDATFFEYTTANISNYNLAEMCFGFYFHPYVGEDGNDDYLFFNKDLNMSYNWDSDGIGQGGLRTCAFGIAYLESPGRSDDGIDNDNDGLLDETRDDQQAYRQFVGPTDGIYDINKFKTYYNYTDEDLAPHWNTDEDMDWMDGNDANGNGIYDGEENPGDDVGLDGVGPGELNYTGPDVGECNHMPDYIEGVGCEPNYAATDVTESDLLGLTSFHTFDHDTEPRIHADDSRYWDFFSDPSFDEFQGTPGAWVNLFATGIFPLYQGLTERISMGLVASYDPQEGLNSSDHRAPSLWRKKEVAQIIYERDYRFAQPPKMPTLRATAGDGKVILTWDDMADKFTREPFLRNINDFEGYKLFKATDKKFSDAEQITDGYGIPMLKKPIFQCDKINHKSGFADYGDIDGVLYYLGEDTGIQHYFVDENVVNGKTYYYAIVAYDYGIEDIDVAPSENNVVLELDEAEEVKSMGKNVAVVTPRQTASGYVPPQIEIEEQSWPPSLGEVTPKILMPELLKPNHTYKLEFTADTLSYSSQSEAYLNWLCNGYKIYDVTDSTELIVDKVRSGEDYEGAPINSDQVYDEEGSPIGYSLDTAEKFEIDTFDGLTLEMLMNYTLSTRDAEIDADGSGWKTGNKDGDVHLKVNVDTTTVSNLPWEYEFVWGDPGVYERKVGRLRNVKDVDGERLDLDKVIDDAEFDFYITNMTLPFKDGSLDTLDMLAVDKDSNMVFDPLKDRVLTGVIDSRGRWFRSVFSVEYEEGSAYPEPNDVYRIAYKRPFFVTDSLVFRVLPEGDLNKQNITNSMDDIRVVPNPYVATNNYEPSVANTALNQRRRIMFTHLPARCNIKIFTVSGVLVDEIDVENASDDGTAYWDLLSSEGLEIAAGIYVYHVEAKETGDSHLSKFGVIK